MGILSTMRQLHKQNAHEPAAQRVQTDWPVPSVYSPSGHSSHDALPGSPLNVPAGHSVH